mgnify:CR=1 FL=1
MLVQIFTMLMEVSKQHWIHDIIMVNTQETHLREGLKGLRQAIDKKENQRKRFKTVLCMNSSRITS